MKCSKNIFVYLCTLAIFTIASGCATDLSDEGLGNAEGGLDYSVDAVDSADISSDEEAEGEGLTTISLVAKPIATCKCNAPPDSSGNWANPVETCSLCTNSADCATATCKYVHAVHGGESGDVGCQFESGTYVIDAIRRHLDEVEEEELEILEIEVRNADLELLNEIAAVAGTCSCNSPPDSSGNWANPVETCSLCTNSEDCATATCKYVHAVHGGQSQDVGCQFSTSAIVVKPVGDLPKDKPAKGAQSLKSTTPSDIAAAPGTCACNPPPDSSGNWGRPKETCSACTNSADCATATCQYRHSAHGGLSKDVGCQFRSGRIFVDPIDDDEVDGLDMVKRDQSDESDLETTDSELSFSLAGSCACNPAPSTQGGWAVTSQTCSLCTNSADCATAECWYTNADGDEEEVGCQFGSKLKKKKKKKKKKIDGGALLDF